jgi:hypothetical protein
MPSVSERARRWTEFVLCDPRAVPALFALYVLAGLAFVFTDQTLNNEGLLTHYWASWASQDLVPVFFYQKTKPVLVVLYAPIAPLGVRATLVAHVIVAATAIPMLAGTARALGHELANVPGIVVASSPLFVLGGPAGLSNADGVVGMALALNLLCARRAPVSAGLVAGLLPWVRFELVLFAAAMAVHAFTTSEHRRVLAGMLVFPLVYAASGAVYHGDALWLAHYPPAVSWDPGNPIYEGQRIGLRYLLEPALALTPAAALAVAVRVGTLTRIERALAAYGAASVVVMDVFPILKLGNFGSAPRYQLLLLPALALLISRALSSLWQAEVPRPATLIGSLGVGIWIATRQETLLAVLVPLVGSGLILELAYRRSGAAAVIVALALALSGPFLPVRTVIARVDMAGYLEPMADWLLAHNELRAEPIHTNASLLAPYLQRTWPDARVTYLAGLDTRREIVELTNAQNGQRERVLALCAEDLYGKTVFDLTEVPDRGLLALRVDPRLDLLFATQIWSRQLDVLAETSQYRIARVRTAANPRTLLDAAIEAHGGVAALSRFDNLRVSSSVVFRETVRLERRLDLRLPSSFAMTITREGREVLVFGQSGDRCWRRDDGDVLPCRPRDVSDHRRILDVLQARLLPHLLLQIDYEEGGVQWVERFTEFAEHAGATIAEHRELTIGGAPDVSETWTEVVPGGADPSRFLLPVEPSNTDADPRR